MHDILYKKDFYVNRCTFMQEQVSLRQQRLARLLRAAPDKIKVEDAMNALQLDRVHAAKLLAGWHKQGVIRRIAHGLYVPVQPNALGQAQVLNDPWVLVPELYSPAYVGGWSALEYWDLTEQLFRTVCVLTRKRTRYGERTHQGVLFYVKHASAKQMVGTKTVWRENTKVLVSDPAKTILDIVDDPYLGAGLQHVMDCMHEFHKQHGDSGLHTLIEYASDIGNGALFKKLGYLAEKLKWGSEFKKVCAARLTKGNAHLEKSAPEERLITKWRLWVPKGI